MLSQQHDRTPKVGVEQRRPGDEELAAKGAHRRIVARPAARADDNACGNRSYARTRMLKTLLIGAPLSEKAYTRIL